MMYQGLSIGMTLALLAGLGASVYVGAWAYAQRGKVAALLAEYRALRK